MKWLATTVAALLIVFAGADAAKAAGAYEVAIVPPATGDISPGVFRINVATGQVMTVWGTAKTFSTTVDSAPLPPGDYHLYVIESLDGKGVWNMDRFDAQSGRTWSLSGGGDAPFTWTEVTTPPTP